MYECVCSHTFQLCNKRIPYEATDSAAVSPREDPLEVPPDPEGRRADAAHLLEVGFETRTGQAAYSRSIFNRRPEVLPRRRPESTDIFVRVSTSHPHYCLIAGVFLRRDRPPFCPAPLFPSADSSIVTRVPVDSSVSAISRNQVPRVDQRAAALRHDGVHARRRARWGYLGAGASIVTRRRRAHRSVVLRHHTLMSERYLKSTK